VPPADATAFNVNPNTGSFAEIATGNVAVGPLNNLGTVGNDPVAPIVSDPAPVEVESPAEAAAYAKLSAADSAMYATQHPSLGSAVYSGFAQYSGALNFGASVGETAAFVSTMLFAPEELIGGLAAETTTGFRAVSTAEYQSIADTEAFGPSPMGSEVKYFSNSQGQAVSFGERMYGPGNYGVVQGEFPTSAIGDTINPATEGPGFVVPNGNLPAGTPTLLIPPHP
jgi:hypothetical protein